MDYIENSMLLANIQIFSIQVHFTKNKNFVCRQRLYGIYTYEYYTLCTCTFSCLYCTLVLKKKDIK